MDDMMNKLQSILNDKESMKQIQELAEMLSANSEETAPAQNNNENPPQTQTPNKGFDLSQLLQGLNLSGNQPQGQNSPPDFDISKLMKFQQIMQEASKPDENVTFLLALRPLLKDENKIKIDRLVKIFKLFSIYPLIKESGLGGDLLGLL